MRKKLIDKDALVAEIKKKIRTEQGYSSGGAECGYRDCARDILSFIDTLEVKEVNLDDEKDAYICNHFSEGSDGGMISDVHREIGGVTYFDLSNIAEHFFKLGLKVHKGE